MTRVDAEREEQRIEADLSDPCRREGIPLVAVSHPNDIDPVREAAKDLERSFHLQNLAQDGLRNLARVSFEASPVPHKRQRQIASH